MEENSPLRFLDYDVSRMIYEVYYPNKRSRQWKSLTNDQFKFHLRNYLYDNRFSNIYEKENSIGHRYRRNIIYIPYPFTNYLLQRHKLNIKKSKIDPKQRLLSSWKRASEYKREAKKLKTRGFSRNQI